MSGADGSLPGTAVVLRVRYAETDQMGVGYHGAFLPWLEVARTAWLREHALPYRDLEAAGVHLPVVELSCRYRRPVRYDDELRIEAEARPWGRSGIRFRYRVTRPADGTLTATAETRHATIRRDGSVRRLPAAVRHGLGKTGAG